MINIENYVLTGFSYYNKVHMCTAEPLLSVSILTRLQVEVRNNERHLLTAAPK